MNYKKEIIAVVDPMCSWCWGFSPVLQKLQHSLPADTKLSLCLGGLRSSGDQAWDESFKSFLKQSWEKVALTSGQTFSEALFEKEHFDYDTEPACRAVLSVQSLDEAKAFSFFHALQKNFYKEGMDITQTDVLCKIVKDEGIDKQKFLELFLSEKMKDSTLADKYKARSMGANSFPSLVFIDEEGHLYVLKGYRSLEEIKKHL